MPNGAERPGKHDRIDAFVGKWDCALYGLGHEFDLKWLVRRPRLRYPQELRRRVEPVNAPDTIRVKRQIQPGADANLQHVTAGARNPLSSQASGGGIPHREVDYVRQNVFRVESHDLSIVHEAVPNQHGLPAEFRTFAATTRPAPAFRPG